MLVLDIKKFFNLNSIPYGINNLRGKNGIKYKVKIDMQQRPGSFYNINDNTKIAITKQKWHNNLITKKGEQDKYWILYSKNEVFH